MGTHYNHLTEADRLALDALLLQGHSQRSAARILGVSPSTVSRELKRARVYGFDRYVALFGQRAYAAGRKQAGRMVSVQRPHLAPDAAPPDDGVHLFLADTYASQ